MSLIAHKVPLTDLETPIVVNSVISLHDLQPGQSAQISKITGRADRVHQLEEFGLRNGTQVQMFRTGNPCILRVAGNKVCLRADDLLHVMVRPAPAVK